MYFFYQFLLFLAVICSPIILLIRFLKNKEDKKRFVEKFSFIKKKRINGNLLWIHVASVGELMSVLPLIHELEKIKSIKSILLTTSTLSSSRIFKNLKFKKTIHQFFPIDLNFFTSKFIRYWKPKIAIFIDSEIWPSMFKNLKINSIPILLMNARITNKSFKRWFFFKNFSKKVFANIDFAFPQNNETFKYLKKFEVKKIKKIGNLKFSESKKNERKNFSKNFLKSVKNRLIFCAASTHTNEEIFIAKTHISLKKRYKNLLTIIIPRHVDRKNQIYNEMSSLGLKSIIKTSNQKINNDTDILIVDTYGETKKFFKISRVAFIGGSLVNHGGQNPIEPARFNLNIIHGPDTKNFKDVYKFFNKNKVAFKVNNLVQLTSITQKLLSKKRVKKINLKKIGNSILKRSIVEVKDILDNEIKKT